jgi:isoleucyl-tRNA synthetase
MLAPMTPFVAEEMYQNLVRCIDDQAPKSVHHTYWPEVDAAAIDEHLLESMPLAMQIASLGRSARSSARIKLRQPLKAALIHLNSLSRARWNEAFNDIVADELNVKEIAFVTQANELVDYHLLPDNKQLGPKFGSFFPKVRAALSAVDPGSVVAKLQSGQTITIEVNDQTIELAPGDVLIQTEAREGLAVASEPGVIVAVDTTLTPDLVAEGLARELVRRVQTARKNAGFRIKDRIVIYYEVGVELAELMSAWGSYIKHETLAADLVPARAPTGAFVVEEAIDDLPFRIGIETISSG